MIQLNSNPMPPRTAKLLIQLIEEGYLEIKKDLEDIQHDNNQFYLKFNNEDQETGFDVVINATGSKTHLGQLDEDDQLMLNLENRQIVQKTSYGWHSNYS